MALDFSWKRAERARFQAGRQELSDACGEPVLRLGPVGCSPVTRTAVARDTICISSVTACFRGTAERRRTGPRRIRSFHDDLRLAVMSTPDPHPSSSAGPIRLLAVPALVAILVVNRLFKIAQPIDSSLLSHRRVGCCMPPCPQGAGWAEMTRPALGSTCTR